jgi:hypothetical protein
MVVSGHGLYLVAVSLPVNVPQSLCCGSPSPVDVPQSLCCGSPALWMCHSLYVAVLPPCECATVFMLRFSRPAEVPQSLCCGSPALRKCHSLYAEVLPALWMCHSLYVAVLPPCGCATVFMLRFSRPVNVPQSLCCGSPALRKCHSLYVLSNTHDAIRYFRPAIA